MFEGLNFETVPLTKRKPNLNPYFRIVKSKGIYRLFISKGAQNILGRINKQFNSIEIMKCETEDGNLFSVVPTHKKGALGGMIYSINRIHEIIEDKHTYVNIPVIEHDGMLVCDLRNVPSK